MSVNFHPKSTFVFSVLFSIFIVSEFLVSFWLGTTLLRVFSLA